MRLQVNEPCPGDSTSTYRGSGVLGPLQGAHPALKIEYLHDYHLWYGNISDGLFLQRPFQEQHLQAMRMAKEYGNPVWCDWDDDLFTVNTDNPAYAHYSKSEVKKTIMEVVEFADHVSVTTEGLAHVIRKFNSSVNIVPNALPDKALLWRPETLDPRKKTAYVRGGSSHEKDWRGFTQEILGCYAQFKDWNWFVQGWRPWFWLDEVDPIRFRFKEWYSYPVYMKGILSEAPSLCVVPLANSKFNESKSNVAWLEASYAGAATLCPDWEAWRMPGAILYKDKKDFDEKLKACLNGEIDLEKHARLSWSHLRMNLMLSQVNEKRLSILHKMVPHG